MKSKNNGTVRTIQHASTLPLEELLKLELYREYCDIDVVCRSCFEHTSLLEGCCGDGQGDAEWKDINDEYQTIERNHQ